MNPIRHVLVAVDFHGPSLHAIDHASRLARDLDARLTLLHVHDPSLEDVEETVDATPLLARVAALVRADGVDVSTMLASGAPADAILDALRAGGADLAVLGSSGRNVVTRALFGSVAERVMRRAAVPVTIVHAWRFESREEAAPRLAKRVARYAGDIDMAIALGREAVPMTIASAHAIDVPVEIYCVEAVRTHGGVIVGALGEDEKPLLTREAHATIDPSSEALVAMIDHARAAVRVHARWLRTEPLLKVPPSVILIADTLPSASLVVVAARALRELGARHVSLAVPACAAELVVALSPEVDRTICLETTRFSEALRLYRDDASVSNVEACELLTREARRVA